MPDMNAVTAGSCLADQVAALFGVSHADGRDGSDRGVSGDVLKISHFLFVPDRLL